MASVDLPDPLGPMTETKEPASIVIETNNKASINNALQKLEQAGNDAYSVFLKARIFWMQQKHFAALTLLENYFVVEIKDDKVEFGADSPYWQLNAGTKELVLNRSYELLCQYLERQA